MSSCVSLQKLLRRESYTHVRQLRVIVNSSLFFLMISAFFPLTMPADPHLLRTLAPGIIWIALLLAMLLAAERLFQNDYEDGVIEQWLLSGFPLTRFITTKVTVHWFLNLLPVLLLCPLLGLLFKLDTYETSILMLALLCGSPALLLLCALAAAFTTGLAQKGMFMALILMPLTIPILIFGSGAVSAAMQGLHAMGFIALLGAFTLIALALLPWAIAGVIRVSLAQ